MSSKRAIRRKSCGRKMRHPDMGKAQAHRAWLIRTGRIEARAVDAYHCNFCGGYHAGHNGAKVRGYRRRRAA